MEFQEVIHNCCGVDSIHMMAIKGCVPVFLELVLVAHQPVVNPIDTNGDPFFALRRVFIHSLRYFLVSGKPLSAISIKNLMRTWSSSAVNHDIS